MVAKLVNKLKLPDEGEMLGALGYHSNDKTRQAWCCLWRDEQCQGHLAVMSSQLFLQFLVLGILMFDNDIGQYAYQYINRALPGTGQTRPRQLIISRW